MTVIWHTAMTGSGLFHHCLASFLGVVLPVQFVPLRFAVRALSVIKTAKHCRCWGFPVVGQFGQKLGRYLTAGMALYRVTRVVCLRRRWEPREGLVLAVYNTPVIKKPP